VHQSDVKRLIANKLGNIISQDDSEMAAEIFVKSGSMSWVALELSTKDSWNIEKSEKSDMPVLKSENDDISVKDNIGNAILHANSLECAGGSTRCFIRIFACGVHHGGAWQCQRERCKPWMLR
jgi:hypothetical protein